MPFKAIAQRTLLEGETVEHCRMLVALHLDSRISFFVRIFLRILILTISKHWCLLARGRTPKGSPQEATLCCVWGCSMECALKPSMFLTRKQHEIDRNVLKDKGNRFSGNWCKHIWNFGTWTDLLLTWRNCWTGYDVATSYQHKAAHWTSSCVLRTFLPRGEWFHFWWKRDMSRCSTPLSLTWFSEVCFKFAGSRSCE